jgi:hypothetical protein
VNRRVAITAAVLLVAVLSTAAPVAAAPPARGAGGGQAPDLKAMMERNKKCIRELSTHASKVTFDRKDLEKYLAEYRSFDALGVDEAKDDGPDGFKCVDLADALKDPKYTAWARERRLDAKDWLLKSLRISLTHTKRRAPAQAAEAKAQMESQRIEMAKHCKSWGPNACRDMEKSFAQGDEMMRESAAMMALLPEPTRAEATLLGEYDARLREATEGRRDRRGREGAGPETDRPDAPEDEDAERPK